jgi:hypothetical protein
VDNSIRLKELQVLSGDLRKGDEGLGICFVFQKGFFWVKRGGWGNFTPLQRSFFQGIGIGEFFWGWGQTQRVISWVA